MRLLDAATGVRVMIVDEAEQLGRGVAFGTTDVRHLLNVPSGSMSARAEEPDDFLQWLGAHGHEDIGANDFARRYDYGSYLGERLAEASARGEAALEHVRRRVTGFELSGVGHRLVLDDGSCLSADAVVLALGLLAPSDDWVPPGVTESPCVVRDPWAPGALAELPGDRDVLLVGTGLTMVDIALTVARPGRVVHAVSRHGLLPTAHLRAALPPLPAPDLRATSTLEGVRRAIKAHIGAAVAQQGDWRPAIDGLRPQIPAVWKSLSETDRGRFLREDLRAWEVRRHRMAPPADAALRQHLESGTVRLHTGHVDHARECLRGLDVTLSCGERLAVAVAVGCTGPRTDPRRTSDPFIAALLTRGVARPGPSSLGLDSADDGRLRDDLGRSHDAIWTLASLRRGNLWETTAIPEIRAQAADVALDVLDSLDRRIAAQGHTGPRLSSGRATGSALMHGGP